MEKKAKGQKFYYSQGCKYFIKIVNDNYTELICEKLAELCDIAHAHYEIKDILGKTYYSSKNLADQNNDFVLASQMNINSKELLNIGMGIIDYFKEKEDHLVKELIKVYTFDLLILNPDRTLDNFGVMEDKKTQFRKITILDNSAAFFTKIPAFLKIKSEKINYSNLNGDHRNLATILNLCDLSTFISVAPQEYIDVLYEVYDKMKPEVVNEIIDSFKDINPKFKNEILRIYNYNYQEITELLQRKNVVDNEFKLHRTKSY